MCVITRTKTEKLQTEEKENPTNTTPRGTYLQRLWMLLRCRTSSRPTERTRRHATAKTDYDAHQ